MLPHTQPQQLATVRLVFKHSAHTTQSAYMATNRCMCMWVSSGPHTHPSLTSVCSPGSSALTGTFLSQGWPLASGMLPKGLRVGQTSVQKGTGQHSEGVVMCVREWGGCEEGGEVVRRVGRL